MKKDDIQIGGTYIAKVSDKLTEVRIDAEHRQGGWDATNLKTGKKVRIKSAQRLRRRADATAAEDGVRPSEADAANDAASASAVTDTSERNTNGGKPAGRAKKKLSAAELKARHKADQENARLRDEREASPDGMTASERAMAETKPEAKPRPRKKREGMSCLDAAAKVLAEAGGPMNTKAMVEVMASKGYWTTDAPTPAATLYSALLRELQKKGDDARFTKVERGKFTLTSAAAPRRAKQ